jgi:glycosyltransferase involved in cell wall biosynthesis
MGNRPARRVLLAGASLEPDWEGGEPVVIDLLRRGLQQLGVEVLSEGRRRSFAELASLSAMPYDAAPGRVREYRGILRRTRPDAVLVFYDFDCSWVVAARQERVPVFPCIQIYWATCPLGTHYIEGRGVCDGPSLGKCLRHMARAPQSPNLGLPVPGLPPPLGLALYAKLWTRPAALARADCMIANSQNTTRVLERAGYTNVRWVHNSVDAELFHDSPWPTGDPVVLYPVARSMQERKGFPHFATLAATVKARRPNVRFRVLNHTGDGLLEGTPYLSRAALAEQLRSVYLAVLPGLWDEPFGLVTVEAMAAGRPVVAYEGGAMSEIIEHGVSGLIVPRGDPEQLAAAVEGLIDDVARAQAMGRAARTRVESMFTYQAMARSYLALIQEVIARREDHPPAAPQAVPPTAVGAASVR